MELIEDNCKHLKAKGMVFVLVKLYKSSKIVWVLARVNNILRILLSLGIGQTLVSLLHLL